MLCVFQKHTEVRVPGKREAEWGKQEEERVVISEKVAGARPQSILQGTVRSLDSELQWEASICKKAIRRWLSVERK